MKRHPRVDLGDTGAITHEILDALNRYRETDDNQERQRLNSQLRAFPWTENVPSFTITASDGREFRLCSARTYPTSEYYAQAIWQPEQFLSRLTDMEAQVGLRTAPGSDVLDTWLKFEDLVKRRQLSVPASEYMLRHWPERFEAPDPTADQSRPL